MLFWKKNKQNIPVTVRAKNVEPAPSKIGLTARAGPLLQVAASFCQHIGARGNQEDTLAVTDFNNSMFVETHGLMALVADGMGGLDYGEEASKAAAAVFLRVFEERDYCESVAQTLKRALLVANAAVFDLAYDGRRELDLGTTLVAAAIYQDQLHWISVGDSRLYLCRQGHLKQLTEDHIYANYLEKDVLSGKITPEEAYGHPERDYLTSYLGLADLTEICQSEEPLKLNPQDKILLCSDGLTNTLSEDEIVQVLKNAQEGVAEDLVKEVLVTNKPHQDNVTVIGLSVFAAL